MKFAPNTFHCPTVGPNLTLAIENYLRSSDQSLTLQTTADYPDYYSPPTQVLPLPDFSSDFPSDPPTLRSVGQWDAGIRELMHVRF